MAKELKFDAANHKYSLNGQELVSVTQVLEEAGLIETRFFTTEDARRGTIVHLVCDCYDRGQTDLDITDDYVGYLEAWKKFRDITAFKPRAIELQCYHPVYRYAGTIDRIGCAHGAPHLVLDIKSGAAHPAHRIQLAAYTAMLENPWQYERWIVRLESGGDYKIEVCPRSEYQLDLEIFICALNVTRWKRRHNV